ncbi:hypothetical protein ACFLVB_02380 [Chloroflexota bacterium]
MVEKGTACRWGEVIAIKRNNERKDFQGLRESSQEERNDNIRFRGND